MEKKWHITLSILFIILTGLFFIYPGTALSVCPPVSMTDYTAYPPFIVAGVKPNLLLMIDNSASMFDLTYLDKGNLPTRQGHYCVDETYDSTKADGTPNIYAGYFDSDTLYEYSLANNYFFTPSVTTSCPSGNEEKSIANTLLVCIDTSVSPKQVTKFVAKGNYLNWLVASKFDVQKQILTGGKYKFDTDTNKWMMIAESRGCVGRKFIKEPITADYVEGGTNTSLGITFGIRGPKHPYNETSLSIGGTTEIDIFYGDYDVTGKCNDAINDILNDENKQTIINDLEDCLEYVSGKTCSLDPTTGCNNDADCGGTPGTCDIVNDGVCTAASNGVCEVTTSGVCTANNGTCSKVCIGGSNAGAACNNNGQCNSNVCSKICNGGGKAGSACNNDNDCQYSSCTVGKVGNLCSVNTDCNVKTCTTGLIGISCVVNADCNTKQCSAPSGKVGDPCTVNTDCNSGSGTCSAPPSKVGDSCVVPADCTVGYKGVCLLPVTQQIKSTFAQSMHSCYQYSNGTEPGQNEYEQVTNEAGCKQIYLQYKICNGGAKDGLVCTADADCTGGGTCVHGPDHIRPGSAAYLCSSKYAGYCATTTDNWETTVFWQPREYSSREECVLTKYKEFCGNVEVPPVIDPSDDPSTTQNYDNLPAIIADMGVEAQLGQRIGNLKVKIDRATAPTGLIQEFEDLIRFGAMTFNEFGSSTECPANVPCTKICLLPPYAVCMTNSDCAESDSCVIATNLDGGWIKHYIGYVGDVADESVGDHSSGLINTIDGIPARTWTPFSEGFYNAIGYFANRTDLRLNAGDFDTTKPPSQYKCQKNNVLLITDGMSTTDLNSSVNAVVSSYNDGDGQYDTMASATCPKFAGSRNVDDLSWLAKHKNIKNFTETPLSTDPEINQKTIDTYVVFNGVASADPGECNPDTLMSQTATNGGGTYQRAENPDQLRQALYDAFLAISGATASGTAVSVLATTGEGEGAIYQAYFYPSKKTGALEAKWTGYLQGLFVDAYGNLREDTNLNDTLDLDSDLVVKMWYDSNNKITYLDRFLDNGDGILNCTDNNSDGRLETCSNGDSYSNTLIFDNVSPIWEAGKLLFSRSQTLRKINTTIDGSTLIDATPAFNGFVDTNASNLRPYLRASDNTEAANIINYIRGANISGYRERELTIGGATATWKLGDIVYSSPSTAGRPIENYNFRYNDTTYDNFKTTHENRRNVVYVGANDGMLHAFNAGFYDKTDHTFTDGTGHIIGEELWAFIPKDILPHLEWLTDPNYTHVYYNDLKPKITDMKIFSAGWGTILIGGMRFGGKDICVTDDFGSGSAEDRTFRSAYFAFDVTDPLNPRLLWTFTDSGLGLTSSYPAIVRIRTNPALSNSDDPGRWYAVFGSGPTAFDGSSTFAGNVYVLDLNSGSNGVITSWTLNTNYWKFPTGDSNAFMADAIALDVNTDYTHDAVYLGETYSGGGKMFRLVTKGTTLSTGNEWELSTLFNAARPITASASAAKDSKGNLWIYFGTGKFIHTSDKATTDQQTFYGIKDICWISGNYGCTTTVLKADLLPVSGSSVTVGGGTVSGITGVTNWTELLDEIKIKNGWYLDFSHTGERNYVKPLILGGLVAWATYIPSTDICTPEGESYAYAVYYETGTAYKKYVFVEEKTTAPATVGSSKFLGKGAPSSLVGMITKSGTAKGFAQTSTGAIKEFEYEMSLKSHAFTGWKQGGIK